MKRFAPLFLVSAALFMSSCGGSSKSNSTPSGPPSGAKKRAFITNEFLGRVQVIDVAKDDPTVGAVIGGGSPEFMVPIAGGLTLVYDRSGNTVIPIQNSTEAITGNQFSLPGFTEQIVVSSDGKTGYSPIRSTAEVAVLDITNRTVSGHITPIPGVRHLVMNKAGSKLLAFSDNQDSFYVINTADNTKTPVPGFDRPFNAVFSADDSKAYILNCGAECGGVAASVTTFDMTTLTAGASVPVSGATVGLSDGTNLYVAGTPNVGNGTLDVITLGTFTRSGNPVSISDGLHTLMVLANGKLYVGARGCTAITTGCLSIYTVAGGSVVLSKPTTPNTIGDVTSIEPINGRTVTYVIEAGNLRIYDQKTDQPQAKQIDIAGAVFDVKQVD